MIIVEVYVPVLEERNDFELDENVPVADIIGELTEMLSKKTKSSLPESSQDFALYSMENRAPLHRNRSLYENGVRDGHTLCLV